MDKYGLIWPDSLASFTPIINGRGSLGGEFGIDHGVNTIGTSRCFDYHSRGATRIGDGLRRRLEWLLQGSASPIPASPHTSVANSLVIAAVTIGILAVGACSGGRPSADDRLAVTSTAEDDAFAHAIARTGLNPDELIAGFGAPPRPLTGGWNEDGGIDDGGDVRKAAFGGGASSRTQMLRLAVQSMPFGMPLDRLVVMSHFGRRGGRLHAGVDLDAPYAAPVMATAPGIVVRAGWHYGYGKTVDVQHGARAVTRYAHLSAINVSEGQTVRPGQVVGRLGSTGRTTAPHLHYEVIVDGRPRNPLDFIRSGQVIAVNGDQTATTRATEGMVTATSLTNDSRSDVSATKSEGRQIRGVRSASKHHRVSIAAESRSGSRTPTHKPTRAGQR